MSRVPQRNIYDDTSTTSWPRRSTRQRRPNTIIDEESVRDERIRRLKNVRSRALASLTVKERNIELLQNAYTNFCKAHEAYSNELPNYGDWHVETHNYFTDVEEKYVEFARRVNEWLWNAELTCKLRETRLDAGTSASQIVHEVRPEDSVSQTGSKRSNRSSIFSSEIRAKEAARIAELEAKAARLKTQQSLREQELRLKEEELKIKLQREELELETELATLKAKEKVYASHDMSGVTSHITRNRSVEPSNKDSRRHRLSFPR